MTGPEEREAAQIEVASALEQAASIQDRGAKIAKGWRQSREDNNFRQMLRALTQKAEHSGG